MYIEEMVRRERKKLKLKKEFETRKIGVEAVLTVGLSPFFSSYIII